jgi:hypothetical protein
MGAISNNVLTVTEPVIKLEKFEIGNTETSDGPNKNNDRSSKFAGDQFPAIRINKFDFNREDILSFSLNLDGMLPTFSAVVKDTKGQFTKSQYPQDGDVVMLYIRSKDESVYKPIRMDFDITEISTTPFSTPEASSGGSENEGPIEISISGTTRLPGLFAETCKAYPENTSYDFFIEIADELEIGFATNEDSTDDAMKRICPFDTKYKLLKDTVDTIYKDDDSFFTLYMDPYYYLNLINVNKLITFDESLQDTLNSYIQDASTAKTVQDGADNAQDDKLYLTNLNARRGAATFISKFKLVNNAASVTLGDGYRRIIQYYDTVDKEYRTFTVEPLTTVNLPPDQAPLKGKYDAEGDKMYKEQQKYKYLGKQSGNVHENYYYAQMLNYKNMLELEKMYLDVELETPNMSLYRYQIIPIIIYEQNAEKAEIQEQREIKAEEQGTAMKQKKGEKGDLNNGGLQKQKVDEKLTGIYTIARINYTYDEQEGRLRQKIALFRREWPNTP